MRRKIACLLLAGMLAFSGCGSKGADDAASGSGKSDADIMVEVEMPAAYVGGQTQEDLDKLAAEYGFESVALNEDGSATYKMTKQQQDVFLEEYREQIRGLLDDMVASADYPNITKVESNDNFTEFTVTTKNKELDVNESVSSIVFYGYGIIYGIFSGEESDNISVTFLNEETGDVISTSNSKDMQE